METSRLIMRDFRYQAEELGLYPEGTGEPCKDSEEGLHDQLVLGAGGGVEERG